MRIEISVPDEVYECGERLRRVLRVSRSRLYSDALAHYMQARSVADFTGTPDRASPAETSQVPPELMRAQLRLLDDEGW